MLIYKNRLALGWSAVDWIWSRICTKVYFNYNWEYFCGQWRLFFNDEYWKLKCLLDTEDASEGETGKKDREFTGIKEQYVILICY